MDSSIDFYSDGVDGDTGTDKFSLCDYDIYAARDCKPIYSDNLGFSSQLFTSVSLPYRNPAKGGVVPASVRRSNGYLELVIRPGSVYDARQKCNIDMFPYGKIPRLALYWLSSEVVKTKSRKILLGGSLNEFITRIGLANGGAQYQTTMKQIRALFSSTMEFSWRVPITTPEQEIVHENNYRFIIAEKECLWFSPKDDKNLTEPLFESYVELSPTFYESLLKFSFPFSIDKIAYLNKTSKSALQLDVAMFLFWRLFKLEKEVRIPYEALMLQFGTAAKSVKAFRQKFVPALKEVLKVYPSADVELYPSGIILRPSPPAVANRELKEFFRAVDRELGQ